jgi:hypothetical protein
MANVYPKSLRIHPVHHLSKFRSMRGAMLPNIKLPLMDHFMRQCSLKFFFGLLAKQGGGQPDDSSRTLSKLTWHPHAPGTNLTHKQPG